MILKAKSTIRTSTGEHAPGTLFECNDENDILFLLSEKAAVVVESGKSPVPVSAPSPQQPAAIQNFKNPSAGEATAENLAEAEVSEKDIDAAIATESSVLAVVSVPIPEFKQKHVEPIVDKANGFFIPGVTKEVHAALVEAGFDSPEKFRASDAKAIIDAVPIKYNVAQAIIKHFRKQ
jgi:hypothetical protein